MRKTLSKILIGLVVAAFTAAPLLADQAKVTFVKGKVEVSRGGEWIALKTGDMVSENETISTGFQSEARLNLNGSVLAVAAMSRVTLENLSSSAAKDNVSLYVNTGAIKAKVSHSEGKKVDFTTHTVVAVASVRGTEYTMTAKGDVRCLEGAVAVYSAKNYKAPEANESVEADVQEEAAENGDDEPAEAPAADAGPATATTAAEDISSSAPANSVVVGAGQSVAFTNGDSPDKPLDTAKKNAEKAQNTVQTAAEKEAASSTTLSPAKAPEEPATTKGKLQIVIQLPDDLDAE